jgi:hypothetical protein
MTHQGLPFFCRRLVLKKTPHLLAPDFFRIAVGQFQARHVEFPAFHGFAARPFLRQAGDKGGIVRKKDRMIPGEIRLHGVDKDEIVEFLYAEARYGIHAETPGFSFQAPFLSCGPVEIEAGPAGKSIFHGDPLKGGGGFLEKRKKLLREFEGIHIIRVHGVVFQHGKLRAMAAA